MIGTQYATQDLISHGNYQDGAREVMSLILHILQPSCDTRIARKCSS
jgi:hypothetical protein